MSMHDQQAIIRRAIEARNTHDVEAWVALWSDDWKERARAGFMGVSATFPDVQITPEEWIAVGDKVVLRWTLRGTHLGPLGDIPATGKSVTTTGIDIYTIADGKITDILRATDNLSLLQQLGATVAGPRAVQV